MIQAIFDDHCEETRKLWAYPDTGIWDPERNTDEFCAMLPVYHKYGLRAVTVGLQGGGSNYTPKIYESYQNSAFRDDGSLDPTYLARLERILKAADACGMVVIVSYFYCAQLDVCKSEEQVVGMLQAATEWLLKTGYRNLIAEPINEARDETGPFFRTDQIAKRLQQMKSVTLDGRRLLVGSSPFPDQRVATEAWLDEEDVSLIHTNGSMPYQVAPIVRKWKESASFKARPRPLVINEDSPMVDNLEMALEEDVSWGFYHQGFGSDYPYDLINWTHHEREKEIKHLTGYQTLPVNWSINDPWKRAFFQLVARITGSSTVL